MIGRQNDGRERREVPHAPPRGSGRRPLSVAGLKEESAPFEMGFPALVLAVGAISCWSQVRPFLLAVAALQCE